MLDLAQPPRMTAMDDLVADSQILGYERYRAGYLQLPELDLSAPMSKAYLGRGNVYTFACRRLGSGLRTRVIHVCS